MNLFYKLLTILVVFFWVCPVNADNFLINLVNKGDLSKVKKQLENGADISEADEYGQKVIHFAAMKGHHEILEILIEYGADVNAKDNSGVTALHWSSQIGQIPSVKSLVKNGSDINSQTDRGLTPLYLAANKKHGAIVEFLIDNGADPNISDNKGISPLYLSASHGEYNTIGILIEAGVNVDGGTKIKNPDYNPLMVSISKGYSKIAKELISNGASINSKSKNGASSIYLAARKGDLELTQLLINSGADVNSVDKDGLTPLMMATQSENVDLVKLLVENGAKVNEASLKNFTPLFLAVRRNDYDIAKLLVKKSAKINLKSYRGQTALHMAAWIGNKDMVSLLIDNGANVNASSWDGLTPQFMAAVRNHKEIEELLYSHKADKINPTMEVQKLLTKGGYGVGQIDGKLGKRTIQGIKQFLKDRNLKIKEEISIELISLLSLFIEQGGDLLRGEFSYDIGTGIGQVLFKDNGKEILKTTGIVVVKNLDNLRVKIQRGEILFWITHHTKFGGMEDRNDWQNEINLGDKVTISTIRSNNALTIFKEKDNSTIITIQN